MIGVLVGLGGSAANQALNFEGSNPIETYNILLGQRAIGNQDLSLVVEALKDQKTAVAWTVWSATGAPAEWQTWLADFYSNRNNGARMRMRAWFRAHPQELATFKLLPAEVVGDDPIDGVASTIARLNYAILKAPKSGAHQLEALESGYGEADADYGGSILSTEDEDKTLFDRNVYILARAVIAQDAVYAQEHPNEGQVVFKPELLAKRGVMNEAIDFVKEKAGEAVEVVYKDGKVTKVGKGVGLVAGLLVLVKVLKR